MSLDAFFSPKSVAVVGASSRESSVGYAVLRNLLYGRIHEPAGSEPSRERGFGGPVYPVNHKGGEILGQKVYESLSAIGEPIDLITVAIPARYIEGIIEEAGELDIGCAIIITAGFAEMGDEGRAMQERMAQKAAGLGVRLIGPNCLGVIRPASRLNASFADHAPRPGRIGVLSQSGALITGLISYADREAFGLSGAVSLGAKADVDDEEILRWFAEDEETAAIAMYVEAFTDPKKVLESLRYACAKKPVVALKGGQSEAGAKAASSHTGALAGSAAAYQAAFAQCGAIQATNISDFIGFARALACQPPAAGRRIAIVTNAGGPGVLCADALSRCGLLLATLRDETKNALNEVLPAVWSHGNPVDVIGDATPERYKDALNVIGRAPEVDGIVVIMTVQAMTDPDATARAIVDAVHDPSWTKPLTSSFIGLVGTKTGQYLDARGVPEFNVPEHAVSAMYALVQRGEWERRTPAAPKSLENHPAPDLDRARAALEKGRAAGHSNLDLSLAREVLEAAGIRYNRSGTADDESGAVKLAEDLSYPVVVKLVSPDVIHKSDAGGVVLGVKDAEGVREACTKIRERVEAHQPGARITGFVVEEMVSGTEIIVGVSRDPGFGPLLMVGMGGVFVEVYKDVTFRLVPLERRDALDMIGEIRAQPLFDGARNRPKLDRAELAEILLRISNLVEAIPEIEEVDLNPLVITERGLVAIDARVIV